MEIRDGGLFGAMDDVPYSIARWGLLAIRRTAFDIKKQAANKQSTPEMKRFVKKGFWIRAYPRKGGFAAARSFVKSQGIERVRVDGTFFGKSAELHEQGGTVHHGGEGVPVLLPKWQKKARTMLGGFKKAQKRPTGRVLKLLGGDQLTIIRSKTTGILTAFKNARGSGTLEPVATWQKTTRFKPQLGFKRTVDQVLSGDLPGHLEDAKVKIGQDWERFKRSKKERVWKT